MYTNCVNATHLCRQFGKKFDDWCCTDTCQKLIQSWDKHYRNKKCFMRYGTQLKPVRVVDSPDGIQVLLGSGGSHDDGNPIKGIYFHHYFITFLMEWLEPSLVITVQHVIGHRYKMIDYCDSSRTCSSSDNFCSTDDEPDICKKMLFSKVCRYHGYCTYDHQDTHM